jgi:hypothetical protein
MRSAAQDVSLDMIVAEWRDPPHFGNRIREREHPEPDRMTSALRFQIGLVTDRARILIGGRSIAPPPVARTLAQPAMWVAGCRHSESGGGS